MAGSAINLNQPLFQELLLPYITPTEYTNAPTGIDVSELVVGGSVAANAEELRRVIGRACSIIDTWCNQTLTASVQTQTQKAMIRSDGSVVLRVDNYPFLELKSCKVQTNLYDPDPSQYVALDCSKALINRQTVVIGATAGLYGTPGTKPNFVISYVGGYPNTTLTAPATAAATTVTVGSYTGLYAGSRMSIFDDTGDYEQVIVGVTPTSNVVTLSAPLQFSHAAGVSFSGLPETVKEAAILVTSVLVRTRGSESLVMNSLGGIPSVQVKDPAAAADLELARCMLTDFQRVWT